MDTPRRSTRLLDPNSSPPPRLKRKFKPEAKFSPQPERPQLLLTNPDSDLTKMDISDVINAETWNTLSVESQTMLKALLPPTAFLGFQPVVGANHPSFLAGCSSTTRGVPRVNEEIDTAVFTDRHFLAAARVLQDHIQLGWLTDAHSQKIKEYEEGIRNGTLVEPWKDEIWERENGGSELAVVPNGSEVSVGLTGHGVRAGGAAGIKLTTLVEGKMLQVGDIIAFKRYFSAIEVLIEKDALIRYINPETFALTLFVAPGTTSHLPSAFLAPHPAEPSEKIKEAIVTTPTQLENTLIDTDGRVQRRQRPNGNAWKSSTVWRWQGTAPWEDVQDGRWGRQKIGTLFHLRDVYFEKQ